MQNAPFKRKYWVILVLIGAAACGPSCISADLAQDQPSTSVQTGAGNPPSEQTTPLTKEEFEHKRKELDALRRTISQQRLKLEEPYHHIERQRLDLQEQRLKLDEASQKLQEQYRALDEQRMGLDKERLSLDRQRREFDVRWRKLDEQKLPLDKQRLDLDEQGRKLELSRLQLEAQHAASEHH